MGASPSADGRRRPPGHRSAPHRGVHHRRCRFRPPSLDAPVGDSTTLGSYISDDQDIAARVTDHLALQWALAGLTLREQKVIVWRYQDECTQTEIGDRLGLSQMQVSRILHHILDNTRRLLNAAPDTSGTLNRRSPRRRPSSLDVSFVVGGFPNTRSIAGSNP